MKERRCSHLLEGASLAATRESLPAARRASPPPLFCTIADFHPPFPSLPAMHTDDATAAPDPRILESLVSSEGERR